MFSQPIRGLVGQKMGGPKAAAATYFAMLLPGVTSWSPPASGVYKAVMKGPSGVGRASTSGGGSGPTAGSGAHNEVTFVASFGVPVPCVVGAADTETDTSMTIPGRSPAAVVAGSGKNAASGGAGGIATGGDYMLNGTAGAATGVGGVGLGPGGGIGGAATNGEGGGPGAPGTLEFPGGRGGDNNSSTGRASQASGHFPGGAPAVSAVPSTSSPTTPSGADGVIYIQRVA